LNPTLNRLRPCLRALLVGASASAVAMLLQNLLRSLWQVRSLPERVMEWLLLFVPLDLFETGLAQFGANAKELALTLSVVGMAILLASLGALLIVRGWQGWRLLTVGLGLWLLTMLVLMPVTGAGLFATGLLVSPALTNAGYLLVFLAYACILQLASLHAPAQETEVMQQRRALLAGLTGVVLSGSLAALVGRDGGLASSSLPLVAAAPATPTPPPDPAAAAQPVAARAQPTPQAAPQPQPTPTPDPFPNPPLSRRLARDQDGAVTAAGRTSGQLAPAITSNDDFYVVTKNAVADPLLEAATWRLVLDGEVNNPVQLDYRTLLALPAVEVTKTLECISNFTTSCSLTSYGCDLLSTARFRGARLSDVLELAGGLKSSAMGLAALSSDEFSAGLPIEIVDDPDTLIAYEMNGAPLPREHGFPARLIVPGRYGMKNPKWLAGIRAMDREYAGWYEQRNWNKDGIVKTMSRIDTPLDGALLPTGAQRVAGIAYAGDRGVSRVELSVDGGATWQIARFLEAASGKDAMMRWETTFVMPATGSLTLTVRATDGTGEVQSQEFQLPQPDGAAGWASVTVSSASSA
jgi:DMSO/TMAO reductase YedYZ molybdopterin-dependent catalytic subunit